jgi:hypothetical protein
METKITKTFALAIALGSSLANAAEVEVPLYDCSASPSSLSSKVVTEEGKFKEIRLEMKLFSGKSLNLRAKKVDHAGKLNTDRKTESATQVFEVSELEYVRSAAHKPGSLEVTVMLAPKEERRSFNEGNVVVTDYSTQFREAFKGCRFNLAGLRALPRAVTP